MKLKAHYDNHLSHFYSWMVGSFDDAQQIQEAFLRKHNVISATREHAIDLGAGHGLQSISLAKLGYRVTAVDFTKSLLADLQGRAGTLSIRCVEEDMLRYLEHNSNKAEVITCMGDTLIHLESVDHVKTLIQLVSEHLDTNGKFIVSFRDLTAELTGDQRFITVRSDEKRILTCFLEYFSDHVMVHDIFHERRDGTWIQKVSSYPKLRLNQQFIETLFRQYHFEILAGETINRMIYLVGRKVNAPR